MTRERFTTMCTHQVHASAPFRNARTVLLSFDWLASSHSPGQFQIALLSSDWLAPAPFRGKRSCFGNLVTVHAETATDDERVCLGCMNILSPPVAHLRSRMYFNFNFN